MVIIRNLIAYRSFGHVAVPGFDDNDKLYPIFPYSTPTEVFPNNPHHQTHNNSNSQDNSSMIICTSAIDPRPDYNDIKSSTKDESLIQRQYLDDYKPFQSVFGWKNIANQALKSFVLSFATASLELNQYYDKRMRYDQEKENIHDQHKKGLITKLEMLKQIGALPMVQEPDWEGLLRQKYLPVFYQNFKKNCMASFIKKSYELYAYYKLPTKLTDKLTKDVSKSFGRKLEKMSRYQACMKIFQTSLYGSFLLYSSTLSVDIIYAMTSYIQSLFKDHKTVRRVDVSYGMIWMCKKIILTSISCTAFSAGNSLGGYIAGPGLGATIGSVLLELIASTIGSMVIVL